LSFDVWTGLEPVENFSLSFEFFTDEFASGPQLPGTVFFESPQNSTAVQVSNIPEGWNIYGNEISEDGPLLLEGLSLSPVAASSRLLSINMLLKDPADTSVSFRIQGEINDGTPWDLLALQTVTLEPGRVISEFIM